LQQVSLDLAWGHVLMLDQFGESRCFLFGTQEEEFMRFRQLIITIVLATDIFDKAINDLFKSRWMTVLFGSSARTRHK
jgi:hypothetical protein